MDSDEIKVFIRKRAALKAKITSSFKCIENDKSASALKSAKSTVSSLLDSIVVYDTKINDHYIDNADCGFGRV